MMDCKIIAMSAVMLTALISCDAIFPDKTEPSPMEVFDELWNGVNKRYVCFSNTDVDWDAVYAKYRGQISDETNESQLFSVCCEMLAELKDGHVSLRTETREWSWRQIDEDTNDFPYLVPYYLGFYETGIYKKTGRLLYNTIRNGAIGYIVYSSFESDISDDQVLEVLGALKDCQGLILDLRGNGGGFFLNGVTLLNYLPGEKELYKSYVRHNGIRDDLLEKGTAFKPGIKDESMIWRKPLIVLIDNKSYSATSLFAMCVKGSENVCIVGIKTGGGTNTARYFELSNGWIYRIPLIKHISRSGMDYQNGVPPDVEVPFDEDLARNEKKDSMIEAACEMILSR